MPTKQKTVFERRSIDEFNEEIQSVYQSNRYPWVIGFSGGKDSTATLQLIWNAIAQLPAESRQKPVYVISSDTLVETPVIVDYIDVTLRRINSASQTQQMPFSAHKVVPKPSETFWVNLIGRGYPAPTQRFRWCTERMKINPANEFVLARASEHGEVVMVLGARISESASRAQVLQMKDLKKSAQRTVTGSDHLTRHSSLSRAYVYTPIKEWETDDVWTYLLQVPSPWGNNNRDLAALYRSAQSGECPLVIDKTTPSCGNSRFGCWVCTVVERDSTMNSLIDNGEDWMEALLEFRDWLAETRDPERKHLYRDYKRRNGKVQYKADGDIIRGPYRLDFCRQILRKLLETQGSVRKLGPDPNLTLISEEELHHIRRIWRTERQDWQDSVPQICHEVMGSNLVWPMDDVAAISRGEIEELERLCLENEVPATLVIKLLDVERQLQGMRRRAGIYTRINEILGEDWRSEEEAHGGPIDNQLQLELGDDHI